MVAPPTALTPDRKKKKHPVRTIAAGLILGIAVFVVALLVTHGFTASPFSDLSSGNTSSSSRDYAITFDRYYSAMIATDNSEIAQQNSRDPATSIAGIDARINLHKTFDRQVAAIVFPADKQYQQAQVLATDAAFETSLSQLRNNRANTANYNAVMAANQPLHDAFESAALNVGK
jgi:hypothetical protein